MITPPYPELLAYLHDKFETYDIPTQEEYYNVWATLYPGAYPVATVAELYTDWIQPGGILPAGKWFFIISQNVLIQVTEKMDANGAGLEWNTWGWYLADYSRAGQVGPAMGSPGGKHPERIRWKFENLGDGTLDAVRILQRIDVRGNDITIDPSNSSYNSIDNFPWGYANIEGNIAFNTDFLFTDIISMVTVPLSDASADPYMNVINMFRNRFENGVVFTVNKNGCTLDYCVVKDSATVSALLTDDEITAANYYATANACEFDQASEIELAALSLTHVRVGIKGKLANRTTSANGRAEQITLIECAIGDYCRFLPTWVSSFGQTYFQGNVMRKGYNDFTCNFADTISYGSPAGDYEYDTAAVSNNVVYNEGLANLEKFNYVGIINLVGNRDLKGLKLPSVPNLNGSGVLRIRANQSGLSDSKKLIDRTIASADAPPLPQPNIYMDATDYSLDMGKKIAIDFQYGAVIGAFDNTNLYMSGKINPIP